MSAIVSYFIIPGGAFLLFLFIIFGCTGLIQRHFDLQAVDAFQKLLASNEIVYCASTGSFLKLEGIALVAYTLPVRIDSRATPWVLFPHKGPIDPRALGWIPRIPNEAEQTWWQENEAHIHK